MICSLLRKSCLSCRHPVTISFVLYQSKTVVQDMSFVGHDVTTYNRKPLGCVINSAFASSYQSTLVLDCPPSNRANCPTQSPFCYHYTGRMPLCLTARPEAILF